ncbi:SH3-domain-containing protein [Amylocystis lapponica]|nr:SH3-domain-containing protein [Amylocystis lapponica]
MSFTNMMSDKEAFFALLDEYFSTRPDILATSVGGGGAGGGHAAAVSAAQNAFSHSNAKDVTAAVNKWRRTSPDETTSNNSDAGATPSFGRVAAAAAALKSNGLHQNQASASPSPRPPPRRSPSTASTDNGPPPEHNKLLPQKKFGDVDISSGKAMFSSLRNSTTNKTTAPPQAAPPTPPAFSRRGGFAPPPVRRASAAVVERQPSPPVIPRRQEVQEEEPEGEWAEALYDYSSEDPGDLPLQASQRVLVVEKNSEDWWTGEIDGRRGLIPAAYVKVF